MKTVVEIRTVKTVINGETFYHTEVKYLYNFVSVLSGGRPGIGEWEKVEVVDAQKSPLKE